MWRKSIEILKLHHTNDLLASPILKASLVAQMVKNLPAMQETWVWSLGQEDPLEKGMATYSNILAWRIPWTEKPGGLQSMGSQRMVHDWVTNTSHIELWSQTMNGIIPGIPQLTKYNCRHVTGQLASQRKPEICPILWSSSERSAITTGDSIARHTTFWALYVHPGHLESLPMFCPPLCSSARSSTHLHCLLCCAKSLQLCPTLCDPMDCSPPVSSVHGILQARILKRVAILSSRGFPIPGIQTGSPASPSLAGGFFTTRAPGKPIYIAYFLPIISPLSSSKILWSS